ncbi:hypothetical protein [Streptomyces sp. R35]|uniref:Uncharacterized protein n=1 Tax=Streptomyces sp. R35 TaxID=3238630 RepID=A0AB39RU63_9ACTN
MAFVVALSALVAAGVGWSETARWWSSLNGEVRLLALAVVLVAALLLAQLLAVQRVALIRLYEGYWAPIPFGGIVGRLRERHQTIHDSLTEDTQLWLAYPYERDDVMPTRLGNVLRAAEEHSTHRYSINGVTAWPRLYVTLPETFRQIFSAAAADLDLAVTLSALGAAFAVVGGGLGLVLLPWYGTVLCCASGCLVARYGYAAAVRAAEAYGQLFRTAFDVHRWTLLDEMGLRRPSGYQAEQAQWRALDKLWFRGGVGSGDPVHLGYPRDEAGAPAPRSAAAVRHEPSVRPTPPPRRQGRRGRALLTGLLLLALLGSAVVLATRTTASRLPTATGVLPPYHLITRHDVDGPGAETVLNRYTRRRISAHAEITSADLGPLVKPELIRNMDVVTVTPPETKVVTPLVAPGDTVIVTAMPSAKSDARAAKPLTSFQVLVLDADGPHGERGLTLAVPHAQVAALLSAAEESVLGIVATTS